MDTVTLKNILLVIQRTINSVDNRLVNHGEQVGYMCLRMGQAMGYSDGQLLPLCGLATIHDIGAYKVEERKRLIEFEVMFPHEHAVYGSLFVRHFGPFQHAANAILYHHWKYEHRRVIVGDRLIPSEAFLIHLADRVSVLYAHSGSGLAEAVESQLPKLASKSFDPDHVSLLMDMVRRTDMIDRILDGRYLTEFYDYLDRATVTSEEAVSFLSALVYAIEFRSRQTVTHSISVASCTTQISELAGMSQQDTNELRHAALLHDVGKITTPLDILTKPSGLTESELEIMRRHVVATSEILSGTGLDRITELASNHHERLNGTGYPRRLGEHDLCMGSRILAIADILAALVEPRYYKPALSKEVVLGIMNKAAEVRDIDADVFAIARNNYDSITAEMENQQKMILSLYDEISQEYDQLVQETYSALGGSARKETGVLKAA